MITASNAKDYLPLLQALADGKTLQTLAGTRWVDLEDVEFTEPLEHYRIKTEPRRWFVNVYPRSAVGELHLSRESADKWGNKERRLECIEVVEVLK